MNLQLTIACLVAAAAAGRALADNAAAEPTQLPKVTVTAEHDSDGYLVERSRTPTKIDTALLDVPQSVTVVAQALILGLEPKDFDEKAEKLGATPDETVTEETNQEPDESEDDEEPWE